MTTGTDPLSAGLDWTVRLDGRPFSGRGALEALASRPLVRKLCLLRTAGLYPIVHG